jgi:O-antigen/teichoic acid export membrane protein
MAIVPMVFTLIINDGFEKASLFLSQVVRGVLLLVIPMIFGVSFLATDIVILLGSHKYADSASLLPILATGVLGGSINFLLTTGLSFQKRTDIIAYMTIGSGLLNILMNLALIPLWGIYGSAWATLATYAIHLAVSYRLSSRYLKIRFCPSSLLKALLSALLMIVALASLNSRLPGGGAGLACKIPIGALVYTVSMCLLDIEVRSIALRFLRRSAALMGGPA